MRGLSATVYCSIRELRCYERGEPAGSATATSTVILPTCPTSSVTVSTTTYVPARVNVCDTVEPLLVRLAVAPIPAVADDSVTGARSGLRGVEEHWLSWKRRGRREHEGRRWRSTATNRHYLRGALIGAPVVVGNREPHGIISSRVVLVRGCHSGAARTVAEIPEVAGNHGAKPGGRCRSVKAHIRKRQPGRSE